MSFSKFKIGELREIADAFGVDVPTKTNRENLILLLEEEGITYEMYEKFSGAEKEQAELEDNTAQILNQQVPAAKMVLVRMDRVNPSYEVGPYRFSLEHPFVAMPEWDAQKIFDTEEGFRLATPREAQEYYS